MAAPVNFGMDTADLKRLLVRSKKEPVNCAIAMGKDGGPLILLDKIKQPRAVSAELTKKFSDMKNPRWGTAFVDIDEDPKKVILTLNKPSPGFARKLKKVALKGTGFTKVEIHHDDGSPPELVAEEDDEGGDAGQAGAPTGAGDAAAPAATPQPQPAAPLDVAGLTKRLTDAVKRMLPVIAADPSRQNELKALATQAQGAIKAADPASERMIGQLEAAIDGGGQSKSAAPADAAKTAALTAVPKRWLDTIASIETDCGKLKDAIRKDFAGEAPAVLADIEKNLARIDQVCGKFDKTLADLLQNAANAPDPASRNTAFTKVRAAVANQIKWATSEPLVALLDDNPFGVSPGIKQKLASALTEVTNASRA